MREGATSAIAYLWIEEKTGNRSCVWTCEGLTELTADEVDLDLVRNAKVLHLDGHQPAAAIAAAKAIVKEAVALRQKYAARFVALAAACGTSGEPMLRSMDYMFPRHGYGPIRDQFVMGDFLMVAPQVNKGAVARSVAIPPGTWRADDGTCHVGPRTVEVATPLSRLPHFERIE